MKQMILISGMLIVMVISTVFCFYMGNEATYWKNRYDTQMRHQEAALSFVNKKWMKRMEHCQSMRTFYEENCKYVHDDKKALR
jgi:hypothetical protein